MLIPPGEKIVETKKCRISGQEFHVTDKDFEFYDKISPVFAGKKYSIPSPTLCPKERQQRRLCFRNERFLYKRKCDATGADVISNHHPSSPYPVFTRDYWFSDAYQSHDYGVTFDFSRTFFDQFGALKKMVPQMHLLQGVNNENSDYVNHAGDCRDCYYIFDSDSCEKCYFCTRVAHCKDLIDCSFCYNLQRSFDCVQCRESYGLNYSSFCQNCRDCWFVDGCIGCQDCLFCTNLKNKQYCVLNQQYSKEEYLKKLDQFIHDKNVSKKRAQFQTFSQKSIKKNLHGLHYENSIGDDLYNVKNVFSSFGMDDCEDCRYCDLLNTSKNCYDTSSFGENLNWIYDSITMGITSSNCIFGHVNVMNATNLLYCDLAMLSSKNCFGCISIKKGSNCIFNKPYSVIEYEQLCGKIIDHMKSTGEWGEFFPHELSPFGYNETVAQEYFPMTESEVRARGWNWYNAPEKTFEGNTALVPLSVSEYDEKTVGFVVAQRNIDTLLGGVIQCEVTGKPFKIIKQELAFYIEHHLPIPTKHPDQRHKERMDLRNPRTLHERTCAECQKDIITTYAPDRPERVVCEECYRKLVY